MHADLWCMKTNPNMDTASIAHSTLFCLNTASVISPSPLVSMLGFHTGKSVIFPHRKSFPPEFRNYDVIIAVKQGIMEVSTYIMDIVAQHELISKVPPRV